MSKVTIRTRPLKDGIMARIYLEFNPPINDTFGNQVRYEFLDLDTSTLKTITRKN